MRRINSVLLKLITLCVLVATTTGCFLNALLGQSFEDSGSLQGSASISECSMSGSTVECTNNIDGQESSSNFELQGDFNIIEAIFDPVVVQFPQGASNFSGTFSGATSGNLSIQAGLSSVPVDLNTSLVAESGTQLVVLDFPTPPPPIPGAYGFIVNFDLPSGTGAIDVKALFTGKVESGGQMFYPPIFPCVTDIAALPSITIPLSNNLQLLDLSAAATVQGCNGTVYSYSTTTPPPVPGQPTSIPTLSTWGLLLFTLLLGCGGYYYSRRVG